MSDQRTIGYVIDDERLVCTTCGYADKEAQHIEPAYNTDYPDGFTCADCCNVLTTAVEKEN
jgi:hypothetical protein